jgi:hypothetical protein
MYSIAIIAPDVDCAELAFDSGLRPIRVPQATNNLGRTSLKLTRA